MAYMGRKMYSDSVYYIKTQNKYKAYQNRGKRSEQIANSSEIMSFNYQKADKMSAVSKWEILRPDLVRYLECL